MDPSEIDLPLKDIHLPPPVNGWPPAPGWWLLLALSIVLCYVAYRVWRRLRAPNIRRLGLEQLAALESDAELAGAEKVQRLSILLRRVALSLNPRSEVAGLSGPAWLQWLDQVLRDGRFTSGPGRALIDAPYRADTMQPDQVDALFTLCRDWLRRVPSRP